MQRVMKVVNVEAVGANTNLVSFENIEDTPIASMSVTVQGDDLTTFAKDDEVTVTFEKN